MRRNLAMLERGALAMFAGLLALSVVVASGCKSKDAPTTETGNVVDSTGTIEATLPPASSPTTESVAPTSSETSSATPATATVPATTTPKPTTPAVWPDKVGRYARSLKVPVWYPKSVPVGYKVDSLDIVELDKGTGLVCDMVFLKGDKALLFTQGSPKQRDYEIVATEKVAWGNETAYVMHQDPADPSTPAMIVHSRAGNFAELRGDLSLAELKKVAASMVRVK